MAREIGTVTVLGTEMRKYRMDSVLRACEDHIRSRQPLLIGVANVAKLVNARRDAELRRSLDEADFVVADGLPVVWLSWLCGDPLPERVAGIDIMHQLLHLANEKSYSVYFLGARSAVVKSVVAYTISKYPSLRVAGYADGYFPEEEEESVAHRIRESAADVLLVAMPSPRKENFLRRWRVYMRVAVCHGVGGSFDVVAGVTKRAPRWIQKMGLEWLFRVAQEPRRMWRRYLLTNSLFLYHGLLEVIRCRLRPRKRQRTREG